MRTYQLNKGREIETGSTVTGEFVLRSDYEKLRSALVWTWDNSKLLVSAFPVPSSVLNTYKTLGRLPPSKPIVASYEDIEKNLYAGDSPASGGTEHVER